jgi:hypothetical protein
MPLTSKGKKILGAMEEQYGSEKKAKQVLYASKNAGRITGIDNDFGTGAWVTGQLEKPEGGGETTNKEGSKPPRPKQSGDQGFALPELAETAAGMVGRQAAGKVISTYAKPFSMSPSETASPSQENVAMGRPPNAPPMTAIDNNRGPRGVIKMPGNAIPEEKEIKQMSSSGPAGTPDAALWPKIARRIGDHKQVATLRDLAAAAGAKEERSEEPEDRRRMVVAARREAGQEHGPRAPASTMRAGPSQIRFNPGRGR